MWSGDSTTTPEEFAAAVAASGLDVVCITDHNAIAGAVELEDRLDARVIVGEELRTAAGEIIGLFLTDRIPMGVGPVDAAKAIRDQGGVVYVPHPFDPMRRNLSEAALYESRGRNARTASTPFTTSPAATAASASTSCWIAT